MTYSLTDNQYISRNCPSCNMASSLKVEVKTPTPAEKLKIDDLIQQWNGFYKTKSIFSYVRCCNCGLLYSPIFLNSNQLGMLYGQMPPNMDEVPVDALERTQAGYFKKLTVFSNLKGGFLEIGPDVGYFVKNCVNNGSFNEYWLIEPNKAVGPLLGSVVADYPHHIIHDMEGLDFVPDNSCDVAVMIHVLDHLIDPVNELKKIRQKLKPDSTLLIVTHDESSTLRKLTKSRWPAFCLQHPQVYNPRSIQTLLSNAGFETLNVSKTKNYFQIGFLIKHLLWLFGIKVKSMPKFLNKTVGLKLGNIITIATPR